MKSRLSILAVVLLAIGIQFLALERPAFGAPFHYIILEDQQKPAETLAALHVQADATAPEPPDAQARRNRELAMRPFLFAACITAGAIAGMLLISWWRKRKGRHDDR